jgi:iron(II)-dependent oxidoreductase
VAGFTASQRDACARWFLRNRRRSRSLFELVSAETYYARPITLRHPLVFYEGHLAAFSANTLLGRGLGRGPLHATFDQLFERGIDPAEDTAVESAQRWPRRDEVRAYCATAESAVREVLHSDELLRAESPMIRDGSAVYTILEHEAMHHETLLYIFHRLPYETKRRPEGYRAMPGAWPPRSETVRVPAGRATLGADPRRVAFGWDNEFPEHGVDVPAFTIDVYDVTNQDYLQFVAAGGYAHPEYWTAENWAWRMREQLAHPTFWIRRGSRWHWRGFFEEIELPPAWPVYVSHAEASAFARWKGKRLPTEPEYHRAAFGTPDGRERAYPWGDASPEPLGDGGPARGNFDLVHWDPVPVGSCPEGASAWGAHDLVGNGWEWTSTVFAGFDGFTPMPAYPGYSADFFDHGHYVMKGASSATARELIRRSWRNWFRARYPYPYATFRCVTT